MAEQRAQTVEEAGAKIAEADRSKAEASLFRAQTREATAKAKVAEISLSREQYKRDVELTSNIFHHTYYFNTMVGETSATNCMRQLQVWDRMDPGCDVEIIFCSPGGSVVDGLALFDSIKQFQRKGHKVKTTSLGYAASMAGILLQAGDQRAMSAESWLLIHEAQFGASGSFGDVEDRVEWIRKVQDRILDIFAERSNLSKSKIKSNWHRKDWWISSTEALKYGFIDIIE